MGIEKLGFTLPNGYDEIVEHFGTVGGKSYLQSFELPFSLRQSWDQKIVWSFWAHRYVGWAIVDALVEIKEFYGLPNMRKYRLDQWGGIHNVRRKKGSDDWSTHAWGIAIDYCPELGPYGEPSRMPWIIVEAFTKRGFRNLHGHDGMHFQACTGY